MITAFTTKFKDIIGHTHMPVSRKRALDEEDEEVLGVGAGEPARKRSRPLAETEEPISRSYTLGGRTILKGTAKRLSNIWSWMSSFIAPAIPNEDGPHTEVSTSELQYLGTIHRSKHNDEPTKRPAITRRSIELNLVKRDHPNLTSIDTNFRFSPSVTSTTAKGTRGYYTKSLLNDRYFTRSSTLTQGVLSHHKKSKFMPQSPIKRLYDTRYPHISTKSVLSLCSKLTGKRKYCTQEAFRHEDKMKYKQLLQQYAVDPLDLPFSVSKVPSIASLSSNSRSTSPQSIISRSHLDPRWTKDKVQQIEATIPKSPRLLSKAEGFTSPLRKNDKLTPWKKASSVEATAAVTISNGESSTKESEDDCFIISEDIKVRSRRNSLERTLLDSPMFDEKWHRELNERYNQRAKMKSENAKKVVEHHKMCEEVRKKAHTSLEDRIALRIKQLHLSYPSKIEEIVEEKEEEEEEELPELNNEMIEVIDDALDSRAPGQVLVDKFNIQITRRDIATLSGLNWLNDEVINFYMNLLMERGKNDNYLNVHAFNTFFYPKLMKMGYSSVRRWTKKVDIFSHDLVLVPVHLGMHWCLATIDFRTKHIRYYDSMLGDNTRCLEALVKYLESEHSDKKQSNYDTGGWTLDNVKNIPQQMNGSDCGMFACKFSEYLSRDTKITFDQQHMPYFRRRMIYEIVSGRLL